MFWWWREQSYGRGGPGQPCHENMRWNPYEFPLIAGRFARGCSPSDIYSGLVSPRHVWWLRRQSYGRGTPAHPAALVGGEGQVAIGALPVVVAGHQSCTASA